MISFHIQNSPEDWPRAVSKLPERTPVKMVFGVERCREAIQSNPNVKTWYRWVGDQPLPTANFEQNAREWLDNFIDGTFYREAAYVDFIGEYNETLANSQVSEEKARWIAHHTAMAKVWEEEYRIKPELAHIRMTLCAAAIGNDIPLDIARASVKYDAPLDYHPYLVCRVGKRTEAMFTLSSITSTRHDAPRASFRDGGAYNMKRSYEKRESTRMTLFSEQEKAILIQPDFISPHDWRWYSGRWSFMDAEFASAGVRPDWIFGEMGPVLDASTDWRGHLDPTGGWKHKDCLNGDFDKYLQALEYWLDNTVQTPAYQEGRVLGGVLFTSGAPGSGPSWDHFDVVQPEMDRVAEFVSAYPFPDVGEPPEPPKPEPPKPPDPEPPAGDCTPRVDYSRTMHVLPQDAELEHAIDVVISTYADRETVGFSYDDAGLGAGVLKENNAVLWGIPEAEREAYVEFYDSFYPQTVISFRDFAPLSTAPGIIVDVSSHQGEIDWQQMADAGVTHAYIRATIGVDRVDEQFHRNVVEAAKNGIRWGGYHYFLMHQSGAGQASNFTNTNNYLCDLPPALDIEGTLQSAPPAPEQWRIWLDMVESPRHGKPVVYTSAGYWNRVPAQEWASKYRLWVANWSNAAQPTIPNDWDTWWLWQYGQDFGAGYGVKSKEIDLNRFNDANETTTRFSIN